MSGITGNSSNSSPGGIPDFYLLNDQNAAAINQKNLLGLYTNLDYISFSEVAKQTLWKYDAQSNKPALDHPIMGLLRLTSSRDDEKIDWQDIYEQLVNGMPPDIQSAFEENLNKDLHEQNPALNALGQLLKTTAQVIAYLNICLNSLDQANPIAAPGSEVSERNIANLNLSQIALQGMVNQSINLFNSLNKQILTQSNNNRDFDRLTGLLNNLGSSFKSLIDSDLDE